MNTYLQVLAVVVNHSKLPLANRFCGKGDVHCYSLDEVRDLMTAAGFRVECLEARAHLRLHAVGRKKP
ncbi:hypothetical protein [Lancefieldella sp. Marseille-Q7238]|uniref:hypothetical protein n=1 Tax=Lancefieldella sp. Marseille-Q7238 TaxID=3022127 RepID=UPI0024A9EC4B|nr:hypothetical protein [Lancefieldella sp. Marseille-Q7238]